MAHLRRAAALSILVGVGTNVITGPVNAAVHQTPDYTGTYISAPQSVSCAASNMNRAGAPPGSPAIHIQQLAGALNMRVLPTGSRRMLHVQRPMQKTITARRDRLATWDGSDLIVESPAPAFPLWGPYNATVPGSRLVERFSQTPDGFLVYRTWYMPAGDAPAIGVFEVRLIRCRSLDITNVLSGVSASRVGAPR